MSQNPLKVVPDVTSGAMSRGWGSVELREGGNRIQIYAKTCSPMMSQAEIVFNRTNTVIFRGVNNRYDADEYDGESRAEHVLEAMEDAMTSAMKRSKFIKKRHDEIMCIMRELLDLPIPVEIPAIRVELPHDVSVE